MLRSTGSDHLVIETGGIGFLVYVPRPLLNKIGSPGDECELFTYLVVREDALTLYGFESLAQRALFETLLSVSGVGPRVALNLLSAANPDEIRLAVSKKDSGRFSRVPGIGKKMAERLILELQGKLDLKDLPTTTPGATPETLAINNELLDALTALGYSNSEANAAIASLPENAPTDLAERLTMALRYFGS
jgi:Holliday junction DNA helicase RuvA